MDAKLLTVAVKLAAVVLALTAVYQLSALFQILSLDLQMPSGTAWGLLSPLAVSLTAIILWRRPTLLVTTEQIEESASAAQLIDETALWRAGCALIGLYWLVDGVISGTEWGLAVAFMANHQMAGSEIDWQWRWLISALVSVTLGLLLLLGRNGLTRLYWAAKNPGGSP